MSTTLPDGSVVYHEPDTFSDILFNGVSVIELQIIEVKIEPSGYGYIMCLRQIDHPEIVPVRMIDNQYLTHTYYGAVELVA